MDDIDKKIITLIQEDPDMTHLEIVASFFLLVSSSEAENMNFISLYSGISARVLLSEIISPTKPSLFLTRSSVILK